MAEGSKEDFLKHFNMFDDRARLFLVEGDTAEAVAVSMMAVWGGERRVRSCLVIQPSPGAKAPANTAAEYRAYLISLLSLADAGTLVLTEIERRPEALRNALVAVLDDLLSEKSLWGEDDGKPFRGRVVLTTRDGSRLSKRLRAKLHYFNIRTDAQEGAAAGA